MINDLKKRILRIALTWVFSTFPSAIAVPNTPLIIGLHPSISVKTTLTIYQPMRDYLEKELAREVMLYSSADVKTYFARLMHGQYDVAVAAPHMARVAQLRANFVPIVYYTNPLSGVVVVPKTSKITGASGLRGKAVAFSAPYTLTNIAGRKWLRDHGLQPGVDVKVLELTLHDQVAVALDQGQVDAAIIGSLAMRHLPKGLSSRFRTIDHTDILPSHFFIVNPKLSTALVPQLKSVLLQFAQTPAGINFLRNNGFEGLAAPTELVLKSLDPYAKLFMNVLDNEN